LILKAPDDRRQHWRLKVWCIGSELWLLGIPTNFVLANKALAITTGFHHTQSRIARFSACTLYWRGNSAMTSETLGSSDVPTESKA
jgi:hypothetical protein